MEEIFIKPIRAYRLTRRERNVYEMLRSGKRSVTEMTISLGYSDIRSYVRTLREKGVEVKDQWIKRDRIRFKLYWVE